MLAVMHDKILAGETHQCGKTTFPFHPLCLAFSIFGCSIDSAQICVVKRFASLDSCPPRAITAPSMLSLSVSGRSAHVTTTEENIILGSGEKGLIGPCFDRAMEMVIHCVVTTGIMKACAS